MANLYTMIKTALCGQRVGEDSQGNLYYQARSAKKGEQARRWVIYKSINEPSFVPADYHAWLHYTTNEFPTGKGTAFTPEWQKPHRANMSGTGAKYLPNRAPATGDYQAWQPQK